MKSLTFLIVELATLSYHLKKLNATHVLEKSKEMPPLRSAELATSITI
jgi:hypothetical protein